MHHHTFEILRHLSAQFPEDRYYLFFDAALLDSPALDRAFISGLSPNCEPVPLRTVGPTARTARLAWLAWHIPRACAKWNVDLFHSFGHTLPYAIGRPAVLTVHDLMPVELLSWSAHDADAAERRRLLLSAVRRATGICAVSESTRREVLAVAPRNQNTVVVVPNAVRETLGRIGDESCLRDVVARYQLPPRFLLTIGPDMPRRNYARLVEAVALGRRAGKLQLPVVFVGANQWSQTRAFQQASAATLDDSIRFLTGVPDDDLSALFTLAAAYVCPSVHEGFCMPALEALACGTPVICSDLPVLHEVAGEDATFFDPANPHSISEALTQFAVRPEPTDEHRARWAAWGRRFDWNTSARTVRRLYEQIHRQPRSI
jgi:glycosyltransferase involved in cell wall biosynthesis